MGKLRKIRRAIEKNPQMWMYRQRMPKKMFKAKHAKFINGHAFPSSTIDPDRGYRMFVRKTIMDITGYTENMIE